MIGSTRDARRAGRYVASSAIAARTTDTTAYVDRIQRANAEQERRHHAREHDRNADAQGDTGGRQSESVTQKHLPDISDLRAQGHSNADLARPLRGGVGDHAVDADHADAQRDARGNAQA